MAPPEKLAAPWWPEGWDKAAGLVAACLLAVLSLGCSALVTQPTECGQSGQHAPQPPLAPEARSATGSSNLSGSVPVQLAGYHVAGKFAASNDVANRATKDVSTNGSKEAEKDVSPQPKQKITLPMAMAMCVNKNFRVLAGAERMHQAEADLITSSLIPNPSLFADCQLIPLRTADLTNQLGPPQWDTLVSLPIDWLVFGKRLAAMQAARLGIEVSSADFANVLRIQLAQTVDTFYEVLMDDAYFKLAEKNLEELTDLERLTKELAKNQKVGALELDRIKLAVHEALLERHDRELALELAKARLRPVLGRTAADEDYEVTGTLTVTAIVPPPKLPEALALAEAHRPDLHSGRKAIDQANAVVELEYRRAKPQVVLQPGWTYQDQAHQTVFHNGSLFDIGVSLTLPVTDRNQGNIRKAQAAVAERQFTFQGDRADALADVEASVASYDDAVEHLTQFNTPETLKAAHDLRQNMERAYRDGSRKILEVLDAQKAYVDRLGHVIEFESFYWRALNKLNAAVGLQAYDPEKKPTRPLGKEADKNGHQPAAK
jgi:cobalt-zinc-cadmium efflux system outer membrane protein